MTETEAKTKWCPFVRQSAQAAHSNRGDHPNAANVNCIGSDCMAWREIRKQTAPHTPDEVLGGYCGLAGRP